MKGQNEQTLLSPSPALLQSLETIRQFMQHYPPQEFDEQCWNLVSLAIGSEECDQRSHVDRGNMMDLYRQLSGLGKALMVIDEELNVSLG